MKREARTPPGHSNIESSLVRPRNMGTDGFWKKWKNHDVGLQVCRVFLKIMRCRFVAGWLVDLLFFWFVGFGFDSFWGIVSKQQCIKKTIPETIKNEKTIRND